MQTLILEDAGIETDRLFDRALDHMPAALPGLLKPGGGLDRSRLGALAKTHPSIPLTYDFEELTDDDLSRMVATNLTATVQLTRDLVPALAEARGRIVNIGSMFGMIAFPFFAAYSATKCAMRGLSDALRRKPPTSSARPAFPPGPS